MNGLRASQFVHQELGRNLEVTDKGNIRVYVAMDGRFAGSFIAFERLGFDSFKEHSRVIRVNSEEKKDGNCKR
jgi:hypothetical protein